MKKKLLAVCLAVATSSVFAQSSNFTGLTTGLGVGFVGASLDVGVEGEGSIFKNGQTNVIPSIDIGYHTAIDNNFVLGVGFTYDLAKTKMGSIAEAYEGGLQFKGKDHYSIYVQPTYVLSNTTAVFAKLGYHHTKGVAEIGGESGSLKFKGFGYGAGVKVNLDKNLYLQAEAQIIDFDSKTDEGITFKPKTAAGILSIGYKF